MRPWQARSWETCPRAEYPLIIIIIIMIIININSIIIIIFIYIIIIIIIIILHVTAFALVHSIWFHKSIVTPCRTQLAMSIFVLHHFHHAQVL